jgi:hypothetical protein
MQTSLEHCTTPEFWELYNALPGEVQALGDKNFVLLRSEPGHPSLRLKKVGKLWSVRVGLHYRALGFACPSRKNAILWFWIGSHADYDAMILKKL